MTEIDTRFRRTLDTVLGHALAHLEGLERSAVGASVDARTLRSRLGRTLDDEGVAPERVISDLVADVEGGILGCACGRFFGWVIGGTLPASLTADWLTAAWDQNAALYACGPAAAIVEEIAGAWLKDLLGLPPRASFAFVTGCQMAHATCLAAARHALLAKRGWDVEKQGLSGAPRIRILSTEHRHGSFERAVRLLGLGTDNVATVAADADGRLPRDGLAAALEAEPKAPTIIHLQAGDISTGSFDAFETLIPLARRYGAWTHVDAAFGLWTAASPRLKHLVTGVDAADSWATDGHKWLNVPFDSGYAFIADAEAHRAAMSHRAAYLTHDAEARDQIDWNPEWSRRARGFATYAALRELGRTGIAAIVEGCSRHAHAIVTEIARLPGTEMLSEAVVNQGLVRFRDPRPGASEEDHDRRTDAVIAAIVADGEAFFTGTTWRGRRAMRVSVCNWRTSDEDVQRTVDAVARILLRNTAAA